jgi:UDP-N-acetylglucosamine diphosphorylase / glucose-1-phosphate thymidylyltransferase / UDP-N-acetylgalactosamine diphosphorylase / glucosamine-1-phosphate N-acetyltransferase / galactosamine-1-phosphate N-acetyltransferase
VSSLYLYDDQRARAFEPFALTRPMSAMRVGAVLARDRWARTHGAPPDGVLTAPASQDFEEDGSPPLAKDIAAGSIIANSRCAVSLTASLRDADVWMCEGRVAAVKVERDVRQSVLADGQIPLEELARDGGSVATIGGRWVEEVWQLVTDLVMQLGEDLATLGPELSCETPAHVTVIGSHPAFVERGAIVEPYVVLDVSAGPVVIRRGATVRAFTRMVGPCVVDAGSTILGSRVHGCSIGESSIIHGELSETVVIGHSNKSHEGFVGHSYLGRWVNLGAGTITSNLKNTYGSVPIWTPEGMRDTGVQKLGTLFGDHVKTGIGLRLTTGSVVGAGANIFGADMPPKYVPPFAWGDGRSGGTYQIDKFLEVASRAMARRQVTMGDRGRRHLKRAFERVQQELG